MLQAAELPTDTTRALEAAAGEFLREVETTAMTRSFKRVVLLVMCEGSVMRPAIGSAEPFARAIEDRARATASCSALPSTACPAAGT